VRLRSGNAPQNSSAPTIGARDHPDALPGRTSGWPTSAGATTSMPGGGSAGCGGVGSRRTAGGLDEGCAPPPAGIASWAPPNRSRSSLRATVRGRNFNGVSVATALGGVIAPNNEFCCDGGTAIVALARRARIATHILPTPVQTNPEGARFSSQQRQRLPCPAERMVAPLPWRRHKKSPVIWVGAHRRGAGIERHTNRHDPRGVGLGPYDDRMFRDPSPMHEVRYRTIQHNLPACHWETGRPYLRRTSDLGHPPLWA
jgi:hypothetical protein